MRVFTTAAAVLTMATSAFALSKKVTTIGAFSDPTEKQQPAGLPSGYEVRARRDGKSREDWGPPWDPRCMHGTRRRGERRHCGRMY